jgi:hypothetical protein
MNEICRADELRVGGVVTLREYRVRARIASISEACLSEFLPEHLRKHARRAAQVVLDLNLEEPIENPATRWKQSFLRLPLDPETLVAYRRNETRARNRDIGRP